MTAENKKIETTVPTIVNKPAKKKFDLINGTIFKQTLKSNWKLWTIFTVILCFFLIVIISSFDPIKMNSMKEMMSNFMGGDSSRLDSLTSLNGTLASNFFGMLAVILPMIFILITGNSLVASQVDRGSMAYTLSTPIKRKTVASTQGLYLATSIICMFLAVTIVGLSTIQIAHGSVFGTAYPADIKAIAKHYGTKESTVVSKLEEDWRLYLDDEAIAKGAQARKINDIKAADGTYLVYERYLEQKYNAQDITAGMDADAIANYTQLMQNVQSAFTSGLMEAAKTDSSYMSDLAKLWKNSTVKQDAANKANLAEWLDPYYQSYNTGTEEGRALLAASNLQLFDNTLVSAMASSQVSLDEGYNFKAGDFMWMVLGAILMMLAIGSISFFASCFFNLSKNSIAIGAGVPVAFYLLQMVSQFGTSFEWLKYLSLNTLFSPSTIIAGGTFWWQFLILGGVAATLFTLGVRIFKKKDLPL